MVKYIVYSLIIFLLSGCSYIVGGNCNYQSIKGTALIKSKNKNICSAKFIPKQVNYDIESICSDKIKVGKTYYAILKKSTHGACTPTILHLKQEIK